MHENIFLLCFSFVRKTIYVCTYICIYKCSTAWSRYNLTDKRGDRVIKAKTLLLCGKIVKQRNEFRRRDNTMIPISLQSPKSSCCIRPPLSFFCLSPIYHSWCLYPLIFSAYKHKYHIIYFTTDRIRRFSVGFFFFFVVFYLFILLIFFFVFHSYTRSAILY